ncbi:DUF29 domain-containing protein [Argonema antarcticum]|uniref:DUF29 domain-containing protein n=1 Tax=Argonema antarcticum TaxID=2942763 RepID=UPI00201124F7|nr:DUF29 domain-containing protein [Argonema antarcticum]MCL1471373.1 DUF29 domain-containing protein [Argonema antarcticum A004/B2]
MNPELEVKSISNTSNLYEQDFYLWLKTTTKLLKEKKLELVDFDNLIEEIESMGRSEKKELKSRLTTLIEHLLKIQYWQAEKANNARGWRQTIVEQRRQLEYLLEDSPSLRELLAEIWIECYVNARKDILKKYELDAEIFPREPEFTLEDILNADYI